MKKILLIDDDQQLLITLCEILTRSGYRVITAPDAESTLSLIREGMNVDLIITDLHLPGMSGFELIGLFKKVLPTVPIIVLTGHASVESYIQTRSNGVFEYLNKPVRTSDLRRVVNTALNRPIAGNAAPPHSPVSSLQG